MNLLNHHLHRLFLDHDCVVVPGLGGFVCNRKPARYDESRQELVPPLRSVLFNERILHHDGVLVESIVRREGISFDEALAAVEAESASLKADIQAGKTVRIHQVGRLFAGDEGRLQFMPDEEMVRILRSFGLKRIPLQPLEKQPSSERVLPASRIVPISATTQPAEQSPWLRVAAAIAVPVIGGAGMFFMDYSGQDAALMSTLPLPAPTHYSAEYQPRFTEEAIPTWESINPVDAGAEAYVEEEPKTGHVFLLVAGSFSVQSNAINLSNDLNEQGFDSEVLLQESGLHLVTFATHFDEEMARTELSQLRLDENTSRAWLKRLDAAL